MKAQGSAVGTRALQFGGDPLLAGAVGHATSSGRLTTSSPTPTPPPAAAAAAAITAPPRAHKVVVVN